MGIPCYGAPSACRPLSHPLAKEGKIAWSWMPTFSWFRQLCYVVGLIGSAGITFLVLTLFDIILISDSFTQGIIGIVLIALGIFATPMLLNWKYNADRFMAYRIARGKSVQAANLWAAVEEQLFYQAKDLFFETKYGGKTLRVLRDGTIEIQGSHKDTNFGGGDLAKVEASVEVSIDY